jgi:hypothetical protein
MQPAQKHAALVIAAGHLQGELAGGPVIAADAPVPSLGWRLRLTRSARCVGKREDDDAFIATEVE